MKWTSLCLGGSIAALFASCTSVTVENEYPADVEEALAQAGAHRPALEGVLEHFAADEEDPLRYDAACFLVANMPGHGYSEYELRDAAGNDVDFDALAYDDFDAARAALDELEAVHGSLDFQVARRTFDIETIDPELLVTHVEQAFEAWRTWPWARGLSYDAFRDCILPYRGSGEPVEDWRTPLMERIATVTADLPDPTDRAAVLRAVGPLMKVGFTTLFYLHPTDQGFAEMEQRLLGRCEDITNMTMYVRRAACIPSAQDYTPHWANRDNNHAWPVFLDDEGRGSADQGRNIAAKVYRKTFAQQRGNLAFQLRDGEEAPPWLDRRTYLDVTDQYGPTTDVTVLLTNTVPDGVRFAYLCVFNGGEWKAIHWGRIEGDRASFDAMGRRVVYLPAYYVDEQLLPAAAPFYLGADGEIVALPGRGPRTIPSDLEGVEGRRYHLWLWRDQWIPAGGGLMGAEPMRLGDLPANGLFWFTEEGSRRLERVFRLGEDGVPIFM